MKQAHIILTLIEENRSETIQDTIRNLIKGMEFVQNMDNNNLTKLENKILREIGQKEMLICYCFAIENLLKQ